MDPDQLERWVTIHRSVKLRSRDPTVEGARMDQTLHLFGVSFTVHWTLEQATPPRRAEWRGKGPVLSRALIRYELKADGEGTIFDYVNEFHAPGGLLGSAASRVVTGHLAEREAHASLTRLKALIEQT